MDITRSGANDGAGSKIMEKAARMPKGMGDMLSGPTPGIKPKKQASVNGVSDRPKSGTSVGSLKSGHFDSESIPASHSLTKHLSLSTTNAAEVVGLMMNKKASQFRPFSVALRTKTASRRQVKEPDPLFHRVPVYESPFDTSSLKSHFDVPQFVQLSVEPLLPDTAMSSVSGGDAVGALLISETKSASTKVFPVMVQEGQLGIQSSYTALGSAGLKSALNGIPDGLSIAEMAKLTKMSSRPVQVRLHLFDSNLAGQIQWVPFPLMQITEEQFKQITAQSQQNSAEAQMQAWPSDRTTMRPWKEFQGLKLPPMPPRLILPPRPPGMPDMAKHFARREGGGEGGGGGGGGGK